MIAGLVHVMSMSHSALRVRVRVSVVTMLQAVRGVGLVRAIPVARRLFVLPCRFASSPKEIIHTDRAPKAIGPYRRGRFESCMVLAAILLAADLVWFFSCNQSSGQSQWLCFRVGTVGS